MTETNLPPPFDWDWRVPPEVEQAARAAEPGGMKPNTDFRMVRAKEGVELMPAKQTDGDDSYHPVFAWTCTKKLQVQERAYLYEYWPYNEYFDRPLCLVYDPISAPQRAGTN